MVDGESTAAIHAEFCGFRIYGRAVRAAYHLPIILTDRAFSFFAQGSNTMESLYRHEIQPVSQFQYITDLSRFGWLPAQAG
jgi:hypothetical protein